MKHVVRKLILAEARQVDYKLIDEGWEGFLALDLTEKVKNVEIKGFGIFKDAMIFFTNFNKFFNFVLGDTL